MKRLITDSEKIYERVSTFIKLLPSHIIASLRIDFCNPKAIDSLRVRIRRGIGITAIEHKEGWRYSFMYGETELNELIRQLI